MSDDFVGTEVKGAYIVASVAVPDLQLVVLGRVSIGEVKTETRVYRICQT